MTSTTNPPSRVREFIRRHLASEEREFWGDTDGGYLDSVVDEWLDDTASAVSHYRFSIVRKNVPDARRVLDVGSGCGGFVFFGLHAGADFYGVEPDRWRRAACSMKVAERGYPSQWASRITGAVGEHLPFRDKSFDCVSSYRTLEHVQNLASCLAEMVRITRPGGGVHISVPDYAWSTFEGHYRMAWVPGIRGRGAEAYVRLRARPVHGVRTLHYVSARTIRKALKEAEGRIGRRLAIIDVGGQKAAAFLRAKGLPVIAGANLAYHFFNFTRFFLRTTMPVDYFVRVLPR